MQLCFENLRPGHLPLVGFALLAGWKVSAFDHDLRLRTRPVIGAIARRGLVKRITTWAWGTSHSDAIAWADRIVDQMHDHAAIVAAKQMYGSNDIQLVFKRCLAERLAQTFEMAERFRRDDADKLLGPTLLVTDKMSSDLKLLRKYGWQRALVPPQVRLLPLGGWLAMATRLGRLARTVAAAAIRLALQIRRGSPPQPAHRPIAWAVTSAFQTRFQGPRRFDFVIDGDTVQQADVAFLLEAPLGGSTIAAVRAAGRTVIDVSDSGSIRHFLRKNLSGPWLARAASSLVPFVLHGWREQFITEGVQASLGNFLFWNAVLAHVHFDKYVCANKEHRSQIALCVLLQSRGVRTVAYSQWIGGPYQLIAPYDQKNVMWSFLNFDVHVLNNAAMRDNFRTHGQRVGRYELVGNLFSELVIAARKKKPASTKMRVAVFDTTFIDEPEFFSNFDDYALFLGDLARLAAERPLCEFLFKPSKNIAFYVDARSAWSRPEHGATLVELHKKYAALPNVRFLEFDTDPVDAIADANAVVTHCFSSPTADALGARVPAIWYGSTDKYQAFPFGRLRGAHVHGYAALVAKIDGLLAGQCTTWEEPAFAQLIDPYCDGLALTRLRQVLQDLPVVVPRTDVLPPQAVGA